MEKVLPSILYIEATTNVLFFVVMATAPGPLWLATRGANAGGPAPGLAGFPVAIPSGLPDMFMTTTAAQLCVCKLLYRNSWLRPTCAQRVQTTKLPSANSAAAVRQGKWSNNERM